MRSMNKEGRGFQWEEQGNSLLENVAWHRVFIDPSTGGVFVNGKKLKKVSIDIVNDEVGIVMYRLARRHNSGHDQEEEASKNFDGSLSKQRAIESARRIIKETNAKMIPEVQDRSDNNGCLLGGKIAILKSWITNFLGAKKPGK